MIHYNYKSIKICFLILLPLFLISNSKADLGINGRNPYKGGYELNITGALEQQFFGFVHYESSQESTSRGRLFSTLSLKFDNTALNNQHNIEFLITKQNQSQIISLGKYEVVEDIEGLLDGFDGVFGYANIKALGEEPFFTKKGNVIITEFSDNGIQGYVDVTLYREKGKTIYINGRFNAVGKKHNKHISN